MRIVGGNLLVWALVVGVKVSGREHSIGLFSRVNNSPGGAVSGLRRETVRLTKPLVVGERNSLALKKRGSDEKVTVIVIRKRIEEPPLPDSSSSIILACVNLFGALVSLILVMRTKDYYKCDIYKRFRDEMEANEKEMKMVSAAEK
ncbi:hypothetical protein RND71_014957 [Anisodus tanguticus]|uniref:Uncharacterized protein n=1 Tax=Anisodus tanguticus TaxID=243964 RepID=A0AAE1SCF0_9SOLA|nr:hypothetical protein RND71_014957 [Anisodus tanguticus]